MKKYRECRNFLDIDRRKNYLQSLLNSVIKNKEEILDALNKDLGKSENEAYLTEYLMVVNEIKYLLKNLNKFARPKRVKTTILNFYAKSYILNEPYGIVLVVSPWNYPINLSLIPLATAIAAGNSVVLKPSKKSKYSTLALKKIIEEALPEEISQVLTGSDANEIAMNEKFDYIFFTGGEEVGRLFYKKAAEDMVPISLELGGKSPAIVLSDSDIEMSAKRIAYGKFLNAGETCIACDYLYCHEFIKDELVEKIKKYTNEFYPNPLNNKEYSKIIDEMEFDRLVFLLESENVDFKSDRKSLKIEPVFLDASFSSPVMEREIFGPILPVLTFKDEKEIVKNINERKTPLALYVFTRDILKAKSLMNRLSFGGGCINDTISHIVGELPFGGFKDSGIGSYHGKYGYYTFCHEKSVLKKSLKIDTPFRYAGENIDFIKRFFK